MVERRKIGLVLGAGVARGWAHIGVLQRLAEIGVAPDIVCGCSSGSIVGASYVTGRLGVLAERVGKLTLREVFGHIDISFAGGGLVEGRGLVSFFRDTIGDVAIEDTSPKFAVVATELHSGRELWMTSGSLIDAVRGSIALPGLVTPFYTRGRWLVDGALVNPLPVSLARALGADIIIGVSLNGTLVAPPYRELPSTPLEPAVPVIVAAAAGQSSWLRWMSAGLPIGFRTRSTTLPPQIKLPRRPTYFEVMTESFFGVQNFVSRVRLAADPVDILIAPRVAHIGLVDFHRGPDAILAGRAAVDEVMAQIRERLAIA